MFGDMFEKVCGVGISVEEDMISLLQRTWNMISTDYCTSILQRRKPNESINLDDISRIELRADEVRSAVYSNIMVWENIKSDLLNIWLDLTIGEQNELLTKAFVDGQVYGV